MVLNIQITLMFERKSTEISQLFLCEYSVVKEWVRHAGMSTSKP